MMNDVLIVTVLRPFCIYNFRCSEKAYYDKITYLGKFAYYMNDFVVVLKLHCIWLLHLWEVDCYKNEFFFEYHRYNF